MTTQKKKLSQISVHPETQELVVVKPIVVQRQSIIPIKAIGFVVFIAIGFITAFYSFTTMSPLTHFKVDPYALMSSGKNRALYTIVDTRDQASYTKGHIRNAIVLKDFVHKQGKKVVLYGYTQFDLHPEEIARQMATKRVDVQILAIGWNEFRHFTNLWVPEKDWNNFRIDDYVKESL